MTFDKKTKAARSRYLRERYGVLRPGPCNASPPQGALRENPQDRKTPLSKKIGYVLTEARVVLPGVQALLGFQLIIIFSQTFETLPSRSAHVAALFAVTVATILLPAPAAYHRLAFDGEESEEFQWTASRMVLAASVVLALGIGIDIAVVAERITLSTSLSVALGTGATAFVIGIWIVVPAAWKMMRTTGSRSNKVRPRVAD